MKNKRGALELSINAVVVIIIAIVMLGLALTFIRGIFGGVMEQFKEVSNEVRKQMEETLKASTKKAALSTNQLDMNAGDRKTIYLGINNYLSDPVDFCIAGPNFRTGWCGEGKYPRMSCTNYNPGIETPCDQAIAISGPATKKILNSKIDVVPLKVEVKSNAKPDTYLIPIHVYGAVGDSSIEEVIDLYINVG